MSLMMLAATGRSRITTVVGQAEWTTPGTFNWTCPPNVYEVCAVAVGAGSDGGGGLGWKNKIPVDPGQTYTVRVGVANGVNGTGDSYFISLTTVAGKCSKTGGTFVGDGGGNGGSAGSTAGLVGWNGGGGGGAGGYTGNGGRGGHCQTNGHTSTNGGSGVSGQGGGGGGGGGGYYDNQVTGGEQEVWRAGGGGGGVGIYGQGANGSGGLGGVGGSSVTGKAGNGGSGGTAGTNGKNTGTVRDEWIGGDGGSYGGGAGGGYRFEVDGAVGWNVASGAPQGGAVRLIWGVGRAFPATRTANE